jgi:hypothetical protein
MGKFDFFIGLKNFITGKIDKSDLIGLDDKIYKIETTRDGKSIIFYDFDYDSNVLENAGYTQDDISVYSNMTSHYGNSYEFYSDYSGMEDFESGYGPWNELDDDNWEKLKYISHFLMKEPFSMDNSFLERFANKLLNTFPTETKEIVYDYSRERNEQITNSVAEHVEKEVKEFFETIPVKFVGDGIVSVDAREVFDYYVESGNLNFPLGKIIKGIMRKGEPMGGWSENIWEYENDEGFDKIYYNKEVEKELDSIIDKLTENEEEARKFTSMVERVSRKFKQGTWFPLPKDKSNSVRFRIDGFDFPSQKLVVSLQKELKRKEFKMTEENFYNLLYQPELFKIGELHDF